MKALLLVVLIAATLPASRGVTAPQMPTRYLLFEHVRINDKPIPTVAILNGTGYYTNVSHTVDYILYFKYTIPKALYDKSEFIVLHATRSKETDEFGMFKVFIADGAKKTTYFITRKEAVNLFTTLHALYLKEKVTTELPLMMEELKTRIYY